MRDDIDNLRRIARLIGDEGFVDALTDAERLMNDAEETIDRVEEIERDANRALHEVDSRLKKVDETISLMEAKIEAGFSLLFSRSRSRGSTRARYSSRSRSCASGYSASRLSLLPWRPYRRYAVSAGSASTRPTASAGN